MKRQLHKKLQEIKAVDGSMCLIGHDQVFVHQILMQHKNYSCISKEGICSIEVVVNHNQSSFAIVTKENTHVVSYADCLTERSDQYKINRKLKAVGNKLIAKAISSFRKGDCICEKTWKKIQYGMEKAVFSGNRTLLNLANEYQSTLSPEEKLSLLTNDNIPFVLKNNWLSFIRSERMMIVSKN